MGWLKNVGGFFSGSNGKNAGNDAYNDLMSSRNQATGYLDPWAKAGGQGLAPLTGLLTGTSYDYATGKQTQLSPEERLGLFQSSPGYQFRMDQAMKAIQGSQAAKGNLLSGGALKELDQYSQGVASDEYGNYLNQLFQLTGMGQQADTAKANVVSGLAAPMADARYSSSISQDVGANRIIQTAMGMGGMFAGGGSAANSGGAGAMGGGAGGTVNMKPFLAAEGAAV